MKRIFALVLTVVILLVMLNGCASTKSKVPSVTLTIAEDAPSLLAFEYEGESPYCFYGFDSDGKSYRVIWDNFGGLDSGDVIVVEYSEEIKSLTYDVYPDGGWTPQYEVKASAIRMKQRANEHLVFHVDIISGKNKIHPYGRLLQSKIDNGDGTYSGMTLDVVSISTVIREDREYIPEIVFDEAVTYSVQVNGRVENIRLFDSDGRSLKGKQPTFEDLSNLEAGTYYVVFNVSLEGNCDPDAPQNSYYYEDVFALIVE